MSVGSPPLGGLFGVPSGPVRRFTVEEYRQMVAAGILTGDDPVELLEGWIVPKMPHNPPHDVTVDHDHDVIRNHLPAGWRVRAQHAITTPDSAPEPDFVVVPGPANRYLQGHPGPQDIAVVIEVADATLSRDRGEKLRIYARAGLVCYWIVNLVHRQIEVYTDPTGPDPAPGYRRRHDFLPGDAVPLVISGQEVARIPVNDLLP